MNLEGGKPVHGSIDASRDQVQGASRDPFGGESQEAFLDRVRRRMRRTAPPEAHPGSSVWPPGHEDRWSFADKAELFKRSLEAVGGRVLKARDAREAFGLIREALVEKGVRAVLTSGGDWSELRSLLGEVGIEVTGWEAAAFGHGEADRSMERADRWGAGLAWADFAVADTGSLALLASPEQGRSVSLVPPLWIALVAPGALVHSRRTVLERVAASAKERGMPSALTFITGPSRSADIENDLSIGVHGPGEVIAILLERG